MSNKILRNGPPAWVLEERRRQSVEQEAPPSNEAVCDLEDKRDSAPNLELGKLMSRSSTSPTTTIEPVRNASKRSATAS